MSNEGSYYETTFVLLQGFVFETLKAVYMNISSSMTQIVMCTLHNYIYYEGMHA